ncbi:PHP domain-containing protein [Candidatus Woesearchaeota archaeon]|nr:PHP domain-containing protein [Candidatus Woesearchaeota archaeon]
MHPINLHTHTTFSDGELPPKALVKTAIRHGVKTLAITDHYEYFWTLKMEPNDIRLYFCVLNHMKETFKNEINLLAGLEIDARLFQEADFPWEHSSDLDLVLFERVFTMDDLKKVIDLRPDLPKKVGLAHPTFDGFPDKAGLIRLLEKHGIFVELNTAVHDYVWKRGEPPEKLGLFFETQEDFFSLIRQSKVEISIGSDHHRGDRRLDDVQKAYDFVKRLNLEKNLIRF